VYQKEREKSSVGFQDVVNHNIQGSSNKFLGVLRFNQRIIFHFLLGGEMAIIMVFYIAVLAM
jgi:hypothetical protein